MAKTKTKGLHPDFRAVVKFAGGWHEILRQTGYEEFIEEVGIKPLLDHLTPAQRKEMLRLLNEAKP